MINKAVAATLSHDSLALAGDHPESEEMQHGAQSVRLSTNLLYDAMLVPNIGVEFAYSDAWSVSASWLYAHWKSDRRHRYWQGYGGELEASRWLSPSRRAKKQGWHVGAYLQGITYDVEWGNRGYQSDGWNFGGGISFGYAAPIAKRLNLDLGLGVGYLGGEYKEYLPEGNRYVFQRNRNMRYWGPTKLKVSLSWLIYHKKEGGKR